MQKNIEDLSLQDFSDASDSSTVYSDLQTINRNIDQRTVSISSTCSSSSSSSLDLDRTQSTDSYEEKKQQNITPKRREREESSQKQRRKTPTPTKFSKIIEENNNHYKTDTNNLKKAFSENRK